MTRRYGMLFVLVIVLMTLENGLRKILADIFEKLFILANSGNPRHASVPHRATLGSDRPFQLVGVEIKKLPEYERSCRTSIQKILPFNFW